MKHSFNKGTLIARLIPAVGIRNRFIRLRFRREPGDRNRLQVDPNQIPSGQRTTVYRYRMPDRRDVGVAILIPASGSRYRLIRLQFTRVPGERHLPLRVESEVAFIASPDPEPDNWPDNRLPNP